MPSHFTFGPSAARAGRRARLLAALAPLLLAGCGDDDGDHAIGPTTTELALTPVASGLAGPVFLSAPAGDARLFVVEQPGRVRIVKGGVLLPQPFLDITADVSSGGERGLLSMAFHPQYATNGYFYVDYTDLSGDTRVERFRVSAANPDVADPASRQVVLGVAQPYANHNGGLLLFGPDGMLYVGMGDGGSGGDPHGNGQSKGTLLGKLLRLDIGAGAPYAVPPTNPFVGDPAARGEIWALGLRNPWRFAFDRAAGLLYVADVGQNSREEISVVPAARAGVNYGWNVLEGSRCYNAASCDSRGLEPPVVEYSHDEGCSVTGGFVYRGQRIPAIVGHYFYSDYCSGFLRSFRYVNGAAVDQREWDVGDLGSVLSFGEDAARELYVLSANGRVYRVDAR